jgi:two-component system, NarL family, response regulator LiaR
VDTACSRAPTRGGVRGGVRGPRAPPPERPHGPPAAQNHPFVPYLPFVQIMAETVDAEAGSGIVARVAASRMDAHVGGENMQCEARLRAPQGAERRSLRVIVVDDDALVRRAIRDLLQAAGMIVVADAAGGREAIELTAYYKPDVVVMDLVMPDVDGLVATRRIVEKDPDAKVVVLSSSDEDELALEALRAGASGFLAKSMAPDALPRALRCVRDGEAAISRTLTMRLIEGMRRVRADGAGIRPVRSPLTPREWEVLDLLCQDRSTEDIAADLVLSVETVRSHVKSVLRKLGVQSRPEAIKAAAGMRSGLVPDGLARV